ncbi:hypothetical protein BDW22DRAFT_383736 [Trametopsis cervina]|nr:hypothetical protein BDW22DRAFT_383736 [Trametopsis cervina]
MVKVTLSPARGNPSSRHFPFQGYLGLTPVRVDGIVTTRLEEDLKPALAKSLTVSVRAYEARQRIGAHEHRLLVEYSQTLWRKPDGVEYADLGESEYTFKITLPRRIAGFSSANYLDYRTYWRIEAVLEHAPIPSVGSRIMKSFDLLLIRYDLPPPLPDVHPPLVAASQHAASSSESPLPVLSYATSKPRAPVLQYNISTPSYPIGPSDLLFISVFIRPLDRTVSIRSASVLVERRIELYDAETHSPSPFAHQFAHNIHSPPISVSSSAPDPHEDRKEFYDGDTAYDMASRSTLTIASSVTVTSRSPLLDTSNTDSPHMVSSPTTIVPTSPISPTTAQSNKSIVNTIAAAEGNAFNFDKETGVWSKTISLPWPVRSHSRWSMGETMRGSLGAVSFWVRMKVRSFLYSTRCA